MKRLIAVLLLAILVFAAVACTKEGTKENTKNDPSPATQETSATQETTPGLDITGSGDPIEVSWDD